MLVQYLTLIETFKEVHKEVEAMRTSGLSVDEVKNDIKHMEKEKDQLQKRVSRLQQKVKCHIQIKAKNAHAFLFFSLYFYSFLLCYCYDLMYLSNLYECQISIKNMNKAVFISVLLIIFTEISGYIVSFVQYRLHSPSYPF